jgi:hypothetical protein
MKLALLITGQPRHIDITYNSIQKNIINILKPDIFIHAWYDKKNNGLPIKNSGPTYYKNNKKKYIVDKNTTQKILKYYNPKKYIIEPQIDCTKFIKQDYYIDKNIYTASPLATYSMYLSLYKCNNLKKKYEIENNIKYDYVIKIRFDILMQDTLNIKNIDLINYNSPFTNGIDDRIFIVSSIISDKICELFNKIDEYYNEEEYKIKYKSLVNEKILQYHLYKLNLKNKKFNLKYILYRI